MYSYIVAGLAGNSMVRQVDRAKFVDLAKKRVSRALKDIQLIGNLSNRSNYDYTEDDVAKIIKALSDEVACCRKKFELAIKKQAKVEFELE
jgi:hypothetical protein